MTTQHHDDVFVHAHPFLNFGEGSNFYQKDSGSYVACPFASQIDDGVRNQTKCLAEKENFTTVTLFVLEEERNRVHFVDFNNTTSKYPLIFSFMHQHTT
jgi:hypothetical protein